MDGTLMMAPGVRSITTKWAAAISRRTRSGRFPTGCRRSIPRPRDRRATTARWWSCSHVAWQPHQSPCDAVRRLGQAGGIPDFPAAVELRARRGFSAGEIRGARWKDPSSRMRSRYGDLPALRRAHRRHSRQADRAMALAPIEEDGHRVWRQGRGRLQQRRAPELAGPSSCSDYDSDWRRIPMGAGEWVMRQAICPRRKRLLTFALPVMRAVAVMPAQPRR